MKKRLLSIILAIAMIFSLGVPAFAYEDVQEPFVDFIPAEESFAGESGIVLSQDVPPASEPAYDLPAEPVYEVPAEEAAAQPVSDIPAQEESGGTYTEAPAEEPSQEVASAEDVDITPDEVPSEPAAASEEEPAAASEEAPADEAEQKAAEDEKVRIEFKLVPADAEFHVFHKVNLENVEIDPELDPEPENTFLLLPGDYTYAVSAPGYETEEDVKFTVYKDTVYIDEQYKDIKDPIEIALTEAVVDEQTEILPDVPAEESEQPVAFNTDIEESAVVEEVAEVSSEPAAEVISSEVPVESPEAVDAAPAVSEPAASSEEAVATATEE